MARYIPVDAAESRLAEITDTIRSLEAERSVLTRLIGSAVLVNGTTIPRPKTGISQPVATGSLTQVLLDVVRANPGASGRDIVPQVLSRAQTKSADPKRMIYSLLSNLTKRGKLRKQTGGGYAVVEPE